MKRRSIVQTLDKWLEGLESYLKAIEQQPKELLKEYERRHGKPYGAVKLAALTALGTLGWCLVIWFLFFA